MRTPTASGTRNTSQRPSSPRLAAAPCGPEIPNPCEAADKQQQPEQARKPGALPSQAQVAARKRAGILGGRSRGGGEGDAYRLVHDCRLRERLGGQEFVCFGVADREQQRRVPVSATEEEAKTGRSNLSIANSSSCSSSDSVNGDPSRPARHGECSGEQQSKSRLVA